MLVPRGSNVAGQLQLALPPAAKPLAGPAAAGLREFTERRANIFLTRPTRGRCAERPPASAAACRRCRKGGLRSVAAKLPANAGTIVIMESDQLDALQ